MISSSSLVSVVVPVYNAGPTVKESIVQTDRRLSHLNCNYEILVVDDGSKDATRSFAKSYRNPHVRVIGYDKNQGKGYALKMGALSSKGDYIVFMDGDAEISVNEIEQYLSALEHADIVVGSKWHPDSIVDQPILRKVLSLGFNVLVRLMTGIKLRDTQVGFKAYRRQALVDIMRLVSVRKYAFDVEVLTIATMLKKRIVIMPVEIHSNALFSARNIVRMFVDIMGITYRLRVKQWYQKNYRKKIPPEYRPIIRW
ncbi:MAG: glycosyltransferase [Thaumarchaeota archaeon]|nr:glycosyltransferase [Nitrososphaerota archaeon]MCL5318555.1 glycosyltransferase [Nitrososphaerota archaeon]